MTSDALKKPAYLMVALVLGVFVQYCAIAAAQTDQDSANDTKSSSSSSQPASSSSVNPSRTSQSHTEADGRTVDKQTMERLGPNGTYESFLDVEKETVKVNSTTTRTVERRFGRGSDGQRVLLQVSEEESRTAPGSEHVVRTVSNPDMNGRLQIAKREIEDTKQTAPDAQEIKKTVLSPGVNGGFVSTMQVQERDTLDKNGQVVGYRKSTLLPDGSGKWQTNEVREGSFKQASGQDRLKEETVSRPDSDGRLSVMERTVTKESEGGGGEKRSTVEKFSTNNPGMAGAGSLHLEQRVTTVKRPTSAGGELTEEQVESRSAGNAESSLHVNQKSIDIVRRGAAGKSDETRSIQTVGPDSGLRTVWLDTKNAASAPSVTVDTKKQGEKKK